MFNFLKSTFIVTTKIGLKANEHKPKKHMPV